MVWRPSNEPTRYDEARVARVKPIEAEIHRLGLPPLRLRKLIGILNALIMQIKDGGDSQGQQPAPQHAAGGPAPPGRQASSQGLSLRHTCL